MNFLKYSKLYFTIAILMVGTSMYFLLAFGLNLGIDFEGGSSISVVYKNNTPSIETIKTAVSSIEGMSNIQVQPAGNNEVILKINEKDVSSETYNNILLKMSEAGEIDESASSIETISPLIGKELKDKTVLMVVVALLAMLAYIALAFRNVSKPISSFQYGFSSTLMLFHDVIVPLGFLAFLGHYYGAQLTIPIVTALLTIVGYCINNNVVVFDRIRENLMKDRRSSYAEIVNKSLNETFTRCVNTSLTVLIALSCLYYFFSNEESLKYFTLIMGIGVVVGIFSSVFLASPLLVSWNNLKQNRGK